MATGRVSGFVRRLAATYESLPAAAGASLRGLSCRDGVCASPAVRALREQLARDGAAPGPGAAAAAAAARRLQPNNGAATGGAGGNGNRTAAPCVGPIVAVSDSAQTVVVLARPPRVAAAAAGLNVSAAGAWTIPAWASFWSPRTHAVEAEAVAAEPFNGGGAAEAAAAAAASISGDGEAAGQPRASLANALAAAGRVVLIERGAPLPLAEKVRRAATAGAAAVVVVDDVLRRCGSAAAPRFDQACVVGSAAGRGFAAADDAHEWAAARGLPSVLVPRDAGLLLRDMLAGGGADDEAELAAATGEALVGAAA